MVDINDRKCYFFEKKNQISHNITLSLKLTDNINTCYHIINYKNNRLENITIY